VNYSIQGGAADIIGLGMLLIDGDEYLADCGYELTLQIHDELLGEVPKEHAEEAAKLVKEYMSDPYPYFGLKPLKLPTPASVAVGTSWGDVH
jgi:DNA polymerase-1